MPVERVDSGQCVDGFVDNLIPGAFITASEVLKWRLTQLVVVVDNVIT